MGLHVIHGVIVARSYTLGALVRFNILKELTIMVVSGVHYILGIRYVCAGAKERSALSIQPTLDGKTSVEDIDTAMEVEAGGGHAAGGNGLRIALFPLGVIVPPMHVSVATVCAKRTGAAAGVKRRRREPNGDLAGVTLARQRESFERMRTLHSALVTVLRKSPLVTAPAHWY